MQVCSPQDIRQAHSQNPPNSRVSLEKPLSLTWLRTIKNSQNRAYAKALLNSPKWNFNNDNYYAKYWKSFQAIVKLYQNLILVIYMHT